MAQNKVPPYNQRRMVPQPTPAMQQAPAAQQTRAPLLSRAGGSPAITERPEMAGMRPQTPQPGPAEGPGRQMFAQTPQGFVGPPAGLNKALERLRSLTPEQARELGRRAAMARGRKAGERAVGVGEMVGLGAAQPTAQQYSPALTDVSPTGLYGSGLMERARQLNSLRPRTPQEMMRMEEMRNRRR